ncbi:hypothetical protein EYB26_006238 [Talaromyces marneffei]|uniref:uncharacterized protein n=1 Tax=Talaromyces marneffei TaxID=37727 RepID=UPI0012A95452|nr:uncharacterized protein EYB26_006238 [Talaromyces marneffei]QGA18553.1 hypothetical protein EYB26_006238 [Talaromyces marneffei]
MSAKRPNFLFILADDLGFSDIGCYGAEIQTPNIDRLAAEGVRMLNHHAAAACSPTRAMLMSGTGAHLGGLGVLIEYKMSEKGAKRYSGKAGYEGFLNEDVAMLPEILEDYGYYTAMSGKGYALHKDHGRAAFKRHLTMMPGCCNNYDYGWEPTQERFPVGGRLLHAEEGKKVDITPNKSEDPNGFYSTTDYYTNRLIQYFAGRSEDEQSKPFFAFLPYTAPHWPLQCSKAQRDKYKGVYDDSPYALRERRLKKLVDMGIIDQSVIPHEVETTTQGVGEWDQFTPEEKKFSSAAMEAYAGMVDSIDVNVGRIVDYLKRTGEYDNTFIVFISDNGAEGAAMEAIREDISLRDLLSPDSHDFRWAKLEGLRRAPWIVANAAHDEALLEDKSGGVDTAVTRDGYDSRAPSPSREQSSFICFEYEVAGRESQYDYRHRHRTIEYSTRS